MKSLIMVMGLFNVFPTPFDYNRKSSRFFKCVGLDLVPHFKIR